MPTEPEPKTTAKRTTTKKASPKVTVPVLPPPADLPGKPFYLSWTLWVNVIALGGFIAITFFTLDPAKWASIEAIAVAVANIVLRALTNQPITLGGSGNAV